ncbi:hypothetical protein ACSVIJ_01215 [Pseudomonas sp. NCHU5208]|uniref:hypothetical protein n=1 Tax=unclassified Pseudomonas TaxID=196821 RepID=UPI003F9E8AC5
MRFFCLLFFALGGNPISKKSEAPEGAKPGISENTQSGVQNTQRTNTQTRQPGINQAFPLTKNEPPKKFQIALLTFHPSRVFVVSDFHYQKKWSQS